MFIFQDKQLTSSKLLRVLSFVIPLLSLCIGAFFFFLHLGGKEEFPVQVEVVAAPEPVKMFAGEGSLALENTPLSFSLPHLERELNLLAMNTRPDRKADEDLFWIELRSSGEKRKFREGETIFLRFVREDGRPSWVFSEETAPISAQFFSLEKGGVKVALTLDLEGEGKFYAHEKQEFTLKESAKAQPLLDNKGMKTETLPLDSLRRGVCWGVDLLIGRYGGATYDRVRHKCKFELPASSGTYFCFLSPGDYLMWAGGKWTVLPRGSLLRKEPVACVRSMVGSHLRVEMWDASGFVHEEVAFSFAKPSAISLSLQEVFGSLRFRGGKQVTALVGEKRVFVREGDWWLQTEEGWKTLKSAEEFDSYLAHKKKGVLFVVDAIERQGNGGSVKGTLFDEMRTSAQPVTLPVVFAPKLAQKTSAKTAGKTSERPRG